MGKGTKTRRSFPPEFKREAVRRMEERLGRGVSLAQISRELEVRPDLLRAWQRQLGTGGSAYGGVTAERVPSDAEEVRRLQRELLKAQQEIAFRQSAAAFSLVIPVAICAQN